MGNFDYSVYTIDTDNKGFFYIEKNDIKDRIREAAEETTSPRGVMPKLFVEEDEENGTFNLMYWSGQNAVVEDTFDTEEEALEEWYEREYNYDYLESEKSCCDYDSFEDAVEAIAENMEISYNVAFSILKHYELAQKIFSSKESEKRLSFIKKEINKANELGHSTKMLQKAYNKVWLHDFERYNGILVKLYQTEEEKAKRAELLEIAKKILS